MLFDRKTIKWKLFVYYFLLFGIFTLSVIFYQNRREKHFRIAQIETSLNEYADFTNQYIEHYSIFKEQTFSKLDSLKYYIPPSKARITVIDMQGNVLYDNTIADYKHMENHSGRPEVQKALSDEFGENIRHSSTTNSDYVYFAKAYKNYVVRSAILYDTQLKAFLKSERIFFPFFIVLFIVFGFLLRYITNHIGD